MIPMPTTYEGAVVAGIDTRTSYELEMSPSTSRIAGLWSRFYGEDVLGRIAGKKAPVVPFGVYTDYESDHTGAYRLLVGAAVHDVRGAGEGLQTVTIPAGQYLVFGVEGDMPKAVMEGWAAIWEHFQASGEKRAYAVDFEVYRGPNKVDIYISVKR